MVDTRSKPRVLRGHPKATARPRTVAMLGKINNLPPGVCGPVCRRKGNGVAYEFSLRLPHFGGRPRARTVWIGTENTITQIKLLAARARAIELRDQAYRRYLADETAALRRLGVAP